MSNTVILNLFVVLLAGSVLAADNAKKDEKVAGFREGGTTFGLNTAALEKETASAANDRFAALVAQERDAFAAQPTDTAGTNAARKALLAVVDAWVKARQWKRAEAVWDRLASEKGAYFANVKAERLGAVANLRYQAEDEAGAEQVIDELDRMPLDKTLLDVVSRSTSAMARNANGDAELRVRPWKRFIEARKTLAPAEQMRVLEAMFAQADKTRIGRLPKGPIDPLRAVWDEMKALEASCPRDRRGRPAVTTFRTVEPWRRALDAYHLWDEELDILRNRLAEKNVMPATRMETVRVAFLAGDRGMFDAQYAIVMTNAAVKAGQKFNVSVLRAYREAAEEKDFAKRVRALRQGEDDPTWFNLVRGACAYLYGVDSTEKGSAAISELVAISNECLWPEERVHYTASWLADAPMTANAAYATDVFAKLPCENRLALFNCWDAMNKDKDLARLKTNAKPHLAADEPGKEGRLAVAYDAKGVHFYAKLDDPDAWKTAAGLEDALSVECSVQTGDEASWHFAIFSALRPENNLDLEWDSVEFGRKRTRDYLKTDVYSAKDCHVVHVFAPWMLAYDRLPTEKDSLWRFVFVTRWAGRTGAIGGGSVHELGRGLQLHFDLKGEALAAVRLGVLRASAGEYRRFRKAWENAEFWNDPSMGDPAFYTAEVAPLLKELDAVATEAAGEPDGAAVARLGAYLPALSDTRLTIDARRAAWLRKRLLSGN